jgi:hypothetical protein
MLIELTLLAHPAFLFSQALRCFQVLLTARPLP